MLKKGDIILLIVILFAATGFSLFNILDSKNGNSMKTAIIKHEDETIETVVLDQVDQPERINVSGNYDVVILVEKGRIRFEKSNCPDQICVNTGWLTSNGDVAVCLPNRTMIKIEGIKQEIDGGTY
ncbi:MAG TPA: NusG domain II-containing protein [Clostridiaceae bacterium]|nr:NusG domain II-containing protein [Clostridiaceae bacterium]